MDDFPGEISLNLASDVGPASFHRKKKIHGDRASRVKQRKELRLERGNRNGSNPSQSTTGNVKRKHFESGDDGNEEELAKKRKNDGIISSLFRKNPDVPDIDIASTTVKALSEQVFTGKTFKDLPIHPFLISNLEEKQGYSEMTEIQRRAIPVLLRGKDALVQSQTGSGKTISYAVPVIQSLQARKLKVQRSDGPYAVVVVPTRELALQSYDTFLKLLRTFIWIVPGCLMGGEMKKKEKSRLRKGVNILVATPGRLLDHIETTDSLSLRRVRWLIIDEADRLLELGYERSISQILTALKAQCPDPPQTVLLSATLSEGVERLSSISLNAPERVSSSDGELQVGSGEQSNSNEVEVAEKSFALPSQLKQKFVITPCKQRLVTLAALVLGKCKFSKPASKMVVFMSTQDAVEFHSQLFTKILAPDPRDQREVGQKLQAIAMGGAGIKGKFEDVGASSDEDEEREGSKLSVFQLHGEMSQKERTKNITEFSKADSGVLVCTDVAARGLDLPSVDTIIQYTSPSSTVDYIHRVGRTARAGEQGEAWLFLMPAEAGYVGELARCKISLKQQKPSTILQHLLSNINDLPVPLEPDNKREKPRTQEEAATYLQDRFEESILRDQRLQGLAGRGFQSYIKAYAAHSKDMKAYFRVSQLHLGHVAKTFALREAPGKVSGVANWVEKSSKKYEEKKPEKRPLSFKQATLSEYSSGLGKGQNVNYARVGKFKKKNKQKPKR